MKTYFKELGMSSGFKKISAEFFLPTDDSKSDPEKKSPLLFLGGVHGDEIEGVWLLEKFCEVLKTENFSRAIVVVNPVNPDGVAAKTRQNINGVDLNRNLPTKDWTPAVSGVTSPRYYPGLSPASEIENKILIQLINEIKPIAILSAHSFKHFQVNSNGDALDWANHLGKICDYPVTENIGYPTPGSLGTYCGKEKNIPTITLEIERELSKEEVLKLHLPVLVEAVRYWENKK